MHQMSTSQVSSVLSLMSEESCPSSFAKANPFVPSPPDFSLLTNLICLYHLILLFAVNTGYGLGKQKVIRINKERELRFIEYMFWTNKFMYISYFNILQNHRPSHRCHEIPFLIHFSDQNPETPGV